MDLVRECGMGDYHKTPKRVAATVVEWLLDEVLLADKAAAAKATAAPVAACDIAQRLLGMLPR